MDKNVKTEVLKHWFGIDAVLFGKPAREAIEEQEDLNKFLTAKGAFLSNLFEIYKKVNFSSDIKFKNVAEMAVSANESAKKAKARAKDLLEKASVLKMVKEEIKEMGNVEDLEEDLVARYVVMKRRNAVALDSMMFESVLSKENKKQLDDWKGKVLIDASKSLRDSLIDMALQ